MITAVRTELLKIRTTRLTAGLLAGAGAWTLFVSIIESSRSGAGGLVPSLSSAAGIRDVLTSTGFALILATVLGVTLSTNEFRHQTATGTYVDDPNRTRVMLAKMIAAAVIGLAFGLLAAVVTTGVGLSFLAGYGDHLTLADSTIVGYAVGAAIGASLLAVIGVGVGTLIRNQTAAIIAVFAWSFGVEQIVGGLFHSVARYLPLMASNTMAGASSGSMPPLPNGLNPLSGFAVVILLVVFGLVVSTVAAVTALRRDIS